MFSDNVVLFNHYVADGKDCWKKSVLNGVMFSRDVVMKMDSDGKLNFKPVYTLTVPYRPGYVDSKIFNGTGFTFGTGNLDVVVCGGDADISDDFTISDILRTVPGAATISEVVDNTNREHLKHWRVI